MSNNRHKLVPASYLVLIKDNKIFLIRRFNTGYNDGNYSMIAGHLDGKESFVDCMVREAREEAGIIIKPEDLEAVHTMNRFEGMDNERIDVFLRAKKWEGVIKNLEPHKCDNMDWFNLDNIPENTISYVKQAIDCIRNKIPYSEHGF